jgi:hypothetical protein
VDQGDSVKKNVPQHRVLITPAGLNYFFILGCRRALYTWRYMQLKINFMRRKITLTLLALATSITILSGQNAYKIPSENWSLEINLDEFSIQKQGFSTDSSMFQLTAMDKSSNINLSIFIEKTDSKGDKNECRDFYWNKAKNSPLAKENVQKYETDKLSVVEHDTKKFNGQTVNFHSLNAYLAQNGYWIDVHISKVGYTNKDKETFQKLLSSIMIKQ